MVAFGSIASFERCRHVGFTPNSGRMAATQQTDASGQKANICAGQLTAGFGNRQLLPAHSVEPCQVLLRARTP